MLALASEAASAVGGNRPRLIGLPTLLLDVPIRNEAEFVFVESLTAAATEVLATVPTADQATLRRLRDRLHAQIEDLDLRSVGDEIGASSTSVSALTNLQRRLFKEEERPIEAKPDDTVEVFSAPGEGRECVEIARRVLSVARAEFLLTGSPCCSGRRTDTAPTSRRLSTGRAFRLILRVGRFGPIPPDAPSVRFSSARPMACQRGDSRSTFRSDRFRMRRPMARLPKRFLAVNAGLSPNSEFAQSSTEEAAEELQSVQPAEDHADEAPVREGQLRAPRRWEHLLIESAVIGGRDRWRRRIDGLVNDLRLRLSELAEEDETRAAVLARTLEDLAAFAAYAIPLIDLLDSLPKSANWGEWLDQLGALATRALKFPDRVLSVLAELAPMGPVGPVALNEVLLVLEPFLLQVAVPPASQRYGKVFVAPIEVTRGMSFYAVFVPGLAEKMFPRKIVEEPILLDTVRERIGGLATNQTRLEEERLALALVAGAAEQRICFSYSRLDLDQARPRVPSFYGLEAFRAAEGLLPDFAELARRAETATSARLGWPAPTDPADAIDEAEYDLALLNRLEARGQESPGAARHLVTANPFLARALRTRYQRWGRTWTASDGLLSHSEPVRAIMAKHTLGLRSYSPTALQNYAKCPYRLFLQSIHGLAPREIPEAIDALDPLQRGSLIHEVQFNLFAHLREDGFLPVRPSNLQQAQQRLDAVIAEVAARYKDDLAPAVDRVWEDGVAAIRADLREWLRRASEDETGYVPWRFELSFGLEHRPERRQADPQSISGAVGLDCGIQLRGSIDLVERNPSGLSAGHRS